HPAGELVRKRPRPIARTGDSHALHQLDSAIECLRAGDLLVCADLLDDLVSNPVHRAERRDRILEDHRDLRAAYSLELLFGGADELLVTELGGAFEAGIG